jgi:hypothetical protein
MAAAALDKMGNYHPILMEIGTQTKKSMEIEVRAIKWAITTRF